MDDRQDKSADFRRQAAACVEIAERMSLREDRARILEMAQRWLALAQKAEAAAEAEHGQQPALQQQQVQPEDEGGA